MLSCWVLNLMLTHQKLGDNWQQQQQQKKNAGIYEIKNCRRKQSGNWAKWVHRLDWTPLHRAADRNRKRIVKFLLNEGADVDIRDNRGRTPDQMDDVSPEIMKIIEKHKNK